MANFYASYPFEAGSGGGGGGSPTGPAGGDLSGTYPNPTVPLLHQDPNTFASFDASGNLESAPGWSLDQIGQAFGQMVGTPPTDNFTSLQLAPTISTPLTGGYEGIIVSGDFSSSMNYNSSYNCESTYEATFVLHGGIGQYQDQSQVLAGAQIDNYSSFGAFPTVAGTGNYSALNIGATLTNTSGGDNLISLGANLNSGYTNSGGFLAINESVNLNVGASVNNYVSFNADPNLNGTITTNYYGLNITPNINAIFPSFNGINISPSQTALPSTSMTAFNCNFGAFMTLPYLPQSLNVTQGVIQQGCVLDTQYVTPSSTYGINNIGGEIHVSSGFPITGGQFGFGNNIGVAINAQDDINIDSTGIDLGFSSVGFVTLLEVASGKTVATLNMMAAGAGIAPGSSGTITNASLFRALGFLPEGGTLNVTNFFGFKADPVMQAVGATNTWAFYDGADADNYFSKISIGTTSQKVTNASVAIEIGGTTKAIVFTNVTTVQKLALTALPGMQVFDTTLNQMSYYNGTTWINF